MGAAAAPETGRVGLTLAVLLGILGSLALFAIAGARRTQSAYPRLLDDVDASTLSIGIPQGFDPDARAAVDALPQVERFAPHQCAGAAPIRVSSHATTAAVTSSRFVSFSSSWRAPS